MAKWGSCDFSELEKFQQKLEKLSKANIQKFCEEVSRELAARLLSKAIRRTPVGDYSGDKYITKTGKERHRRYKTVNFTTSKGQKVKFRASTIGKVGGTLRRGWTAKTMQEAESGSGKTTSQEKITAWVKKLPIKHIGNIYQIDVTNVVDYASYVEYGHRTKNHKGWVEGQFMLTISEKELDAQLPKLIETKIMQLLSEVF